jgi:hypothetical protein
LAKSGDDVTVFEADGKATFVCGFISSIPGGDMTFEIIFIFVPLIVNGLFSMSEMAVVSVRKARLQKRAADCNAGAQTAKVLVSRKI